MRFQLYACNKFEGRFLRSHAHPPGKFICVPTIEHELVDLHVCATVVALVLIGKKSVLVIRSGLCMGLPTVLLPAQS